MERENMQESEKTPLLTLSPVIGNGDHGFDQSTSSDDITVAVVFSTLVAVCGSYTFGCAVGYSSPAEAGIVDDFGISTAQYSMFGSIMTFGAMCGAVFSGTMTDLFGCRVTMWFSEVFCTLGWLAIAFAQGVWWLDIGRLLTGFGVGILSYVVPVYISEITPMNVRGRFTSCSQLMVTAGTAFSFFIGNAFTWRVLAIIGTIPCLLQIIGLFFVPESPRWLAKVGRKSECEASLQRLRGKNANILQEARDIEEFTENLLRISKSGIFDLYAYSVIIGVGLMVLQQFGGMNGFTFYTSFIFESAGFSTTIGTIAAGLIQIVMNFLGVFLTDVLGRRPLLMIAAAGQCLGAFLTGMSFFLQDFNWCRNFSPILVLVGVVIFVGFFALGMGGIPWLIMSEIFPANIKGSAGSLVTFVSWLGSWVVSYSFNYIFEWSSAGTFFIYSCVCAFGILFVAKLVPETKGRTLEEIQSSLIGSAE